MMEKTSFAAAALLVLTGCAVCFPEYGSRKNLTQIEMTRRSAEELERNRIDELKTNRPI